MSNQDPNNTPGAFNFGQPPAQTQGFGQPPAQTQGFGQPPAQSQGFDANSWAARYANVTAEEGDVPFLANGSNGQDVQTDVCYILEMITPIQNGRTDSKKQEYNRVDFRVVAADSPTGSQPGTHARVLWLDTGYEYMLRGTKAFMDGMIGSKTPTIEQMAQLSQDPSPYVGRFVGCRCATAKNPQFSRYTWAHISPETQQKIEAHLQASGTFSVSDIRQLVLS